MDIHPISEINIAPKVSGVYYLHCKKYYVGSSINIFNRLKTHISLLKHGKHRNTVLQSAWCVATATYGILCICDESNLITLEEDWIHQLYPNTFNRWTTHQELPSLERVQIYLSTRIQIGCKAECWPWTGRYHHSRARAIIEINGKKKEFAPHRLAYYAYYGINPGSNIVRHQCNNKNCCNPYHLILGSYHQNTIDYQNTLMLGEASSLYKYKDAIVTARQNGITYRQLEQQYQVHNSAIVKFVSKVAPELLGIRNGMTYSEMARKSNITRVKK